MTKPIKLAVVGHTNVGKTSLLRTLLRDRQFGEVSARPSTTRHVEGARLKAEGQSIVELYDTPGLEDAIALLDYLERLSPAAERLTGPQRLARFLQSAEASRRFEQEAKVLRQLQASDAGLYVIDVREPVLAKYQDELSALNLCGKPLLPVFNFSASPANREVEWSAALAELGLHAKVSFDSIAPPIEGEARLYDSLALLLDEARPALQQLLNEHQQQAQLRRQAGLRLIAELAIDCAACRRLARSEQAVSATEQLQDQIRQREQQCVDSLLRLYGFAAQDAPALDLPFSEGRWSDDLFNPETLRQLGLQLGSGVLAGAAAGASLDLLVGGLSLGAATVLGALAGGGLQTVRGYGQRLLGKLKGYSELTVADEILVLLIHRQKLLLEALQRRGHAAQQPLESPTVDAAHSPLPKPLQQARAHPQWSSLNPHAQLEHNARGQLIEQLVSLL